MNTKIIRIEQKEADASQVDMIVNKEIKNLENKGHRIKDLKLAVGRDADINSGIKNRFSITVILMYE